MVTTATRPAIADPMQALGLHPSDWVGFCWATTQHLPHIAASFVHHVQKLTVLLCCAVLCRAAYQAADGYMAACVSKGRLALFSDNKLKVGPSHSSWTGRAA
jgi:hypothetical protein